MDPGHATFFFLGHATFTNLEYSKCNSYLWPAGKKLPVQLEGSIDILEPPRYHIFVPKISRAKPIRHIVIMF